jgi:hypothetical protein
MSKKSKTKKQAKQAEPVAKLRLSNYALRYGFIFAFYLIVLAILKYQAGVNYISVFAIIALILSAKFTSIKFFTDQQRFYTKEEKTKIIWSSWALTWFISIIVTVLSTYELAGKAALDELVYMFSSMPTLTFILVLFAASVTAFALLFVSYSFLANKEFESLKRQDKIK